MSAFQLARAALCIGATLLNASCARGPTCAEGACPGETICDLDGTCRPLAVTPTGAHDQHLRASDFAGTRADQPDESSADLDELVLGGSPRGAVYLGFDLPAGSVHEAILVLFPAEGSSGGERQSIRVSRVRAFEGDSLSHRRRPIVSRVGPARQLAAVPGRPIRLDVTELLTDEPSSRVHLVAEGDGAGLPWRIASPVAIDTERSPRLELRLTRR